MSPRLIPLLSARPEPLGSPVSISGELTINGAAAPGQTVTITRIPNGGTPVSIGQATTDSNGDFAISDTPPALGTYTYSASFAGDSATAPAMATSDVTICDTAQLTLKGPATVRPNQKFEISGALTFESGVSAKGDTITITLIDLVGPGGGPREASSVTVSTVTAGDQGKFSLLTSVPADGSYAYTASYSDPSGLVTAQTTLYVTAQG